MSPPLQERIQRLYDDTTRGWVDVWGEHLHHGHYSARGEPQKDHLQAQVDMIDALLDWAGAPGPQSDRSGEAGIHSRPGPRGKQAERAGSESDRSGEAGIHSRPGPRGLRILDAGCGVGGSARHLARRFAAQVDGVTLSPVQKRIADDLTQAAGLDDDVRVHVADANRTPFEDGTFDLVWSLESGEHMPDKSAFLQECLRVLRPGGRLIAATWCHRPDPTPLSDGERRHLASISRAYGSSLTWVPLRRYEELLGHLPVHQVRTEDWSATVYPFWSAVIRSVFTPKGVRALVGGGRSMVRGAWGGLYMRSGIRSGLVRYVVMTAVKDGNNEDMA
ncbi:MAG: methyltransferase domain-containing protein [Myxococcota bacterium]